MTLKQLTMPQFVRSRYFSPAFFVVLSMVLYGATLGGDFVYDDRFFMLKGELRTVQYLLQTWFEPSLKDMMDFPHYRPLTFFTFALNFILFGESPASFHAFNILLNGLCGFLLFVLMEKLFKNRPLAWITAIFFSLLPIHTEAIAYIKARDEMLVAFFGLLAWISLLRATEGMGKSSFRWSVIAAACSLAAFLSKESAVVLPGVFVGAMLLMHGWKNVLRAWAAIVAQTGAVIVFFAMHFMAVGSRAIPNFEILYFGQNPLGYMTPDYIPWTALELFFIAASKTFVPWNLSATYGFNHIPIINGPLGSWMAPAGIIAEILLLACIAVPKIRRTPVGVGALTFLVLYFPFSKIPIVHGIDFFAERWLYAPSVGLCMIAGYVGWKLWVHRRNFSVVLFAVVAISYLAVLVPRTRVWHDNLLLGQSMVRTAPQSVTSHVFLANQMLQYNMPEESAELITVALSITRDHIPVHHVAAAVALQLGNVAVADQAVAEAERLGEELTNEILRSTVLSKQGRYQESLDNILQNRWYNPMEYRTRMLLALNLWQLGRKEEAEQYFDWDAYIYSSQKLTLEQKIEMIEGY